VNPTRDAEVALRSWRLVDPASAIGEVCWPADLPVFTGHFPGQPLVPGVHQVAVMALVVQLATGRGDLAVTGLLRSKWLAPVRPGEVLSLNVRWRDQDGGLQIDAELRHAAQAIAASCRLRLGRVLRASNG